MWRKLQDISTSTTPVVIIQWILYELQWIYKQLLSEPFLDKQKRLILEH